MNKNKTQDYRADIDGLRALAVGAVLLFHAFPAVVPGGFVGVDIFFVISGFLISRIIFLGLEQEKFRFLDFYARRIKRIYPALILVLGATLAFGWVALLAGEYERLGKHVASGAAFISNFVLWNESGYFDAAAIAKPLLHLWSLGVEEQFYIVWPLFLWIAWRLSFNFLLVTGLVALSSFAVNVFLIGAAPSAVFYFPFTRFWELMLGAMLAYVSTNGAGVRTHKWVSGSLVPETWRDGISLFGIGLIALSLLIVEERNFPGAQALLPTMGALMLIAAGPDALVNRTVLSCRVMVGIGLISYPLYLWHWPLISFVTIIQGEVSAAMRVSLLIASFLLAWATYRLVETPLRRFSGRHLTTISLSLLMLAVGLGGMLPFAREGLPGRSVVLANKPLDAGSEGGYPSHTSPCTFLKPEEQKLFYCAIDTRESPRFALLGDSKAGALFPGLFRTASRGGTWVFFGSGESGPLVPIITDDAQFANLNKVAIEAAIQKILDASDVHTVVIATAARALFKLQNDYSIADLPESKNFQIAFQGLNAAVSRLVSGGKKVVLLVDNPTLPHMEDCIDRVTSSSYVNKILAKPSSQSCQITLTMQRKLSAQYLDLLNAVEKSHPGEVSVFDASDALCVSGVCSPTKDGKFLYNVTDHISEYGAKLVGAELNKSLVRSRRSVAPLGDVVLKNWGPRDVRRGFAANAQANGASAIWMQIENLNRYGEVLVYFGTNGVKREASVEEKLLTVEIPPEVINNAGHHEIIVEEPGGRRTTVGVFTVE